MITKYNLQNFLKAKGDSMHCGPKPFNNGESPKQFNARCENLSRMKDVTWFYNEFNVSELEEFADILPIEGIEEGE